MQWNVPRSNLKFCTSHIQEPVLNLLPFLIYINDVDDLYLSLGSMLVLYEDVLIGIRSLYMWIFGCPLKSLSR